MALLKNMRSIETHGQIYEQLANGHLLPNLHHHLQIGSFFHPHTANEGFCAYITLHSLNYENSPVTLKKLCGYSRVHLMPR